MSTSQYGRLRWIEREVPDEIGTVHAERVLQQEVTEEVPVFPDITRWIDVPLEQEEPQAVVPVNPVTFNPITFDPDGSQHL